MSMYVILYWNCFNCDLAVVWVFLRPISLEFKLKFEVLGKY